MFVLIVTGLSGAGKSMVLSRLEDNGFYCVDNLPSSLIRGFVSQCQAADIERAALVIDARESAFGLGGTHTLKEIDAIGVECKILFLDCQDEALLRRYDETRRKHPFAKDGDVRGAIAYERTQLLPLRERAHIVIDTTRLTPLALFSHLDDALMLRPADRLIVQCMSFGFKRGMPMDADVVLDMRFLPNPFYDSALRPLSGLDEPVRTYVMGFREAVSFMAAAERLIKTMLPGYAKQGNQRLMVAFGCTGGRHRSVVAAEELARRLRPQYAVQCVHRDFTLEQQSIHERFPPAQKEGS